MSENIKRMLEEKLGYGFRIEELPPALRAKIKGLQQELEALESRRLEIESELSEEEEKVCNEISRKYDESIRALENVREVKRSAQKAFQTLAEALYKLARIFLFLFIGYWIGGWIIGMVFLGGAAWILWILFLVFALLFAILGAVLDNYGDRLLKEVNRKENELIIKKNSELEATKDKLRQHHLWVLNERMAPLWEKFYRNFNQATSEIDSTLKIIFQTKIEYACYAKDEEIRKDIDEKIEKVMRFLKELEEEVINAYNTIYGCI